MATSMVHIDRLPGGVATLTLERPPVNALDPDFLDAVDGALAELRDDGDARALVITGAGKTFSAGMDLKEVQQFTANDQTATLETLSRLLARLYGFPKPVIAAVNGPAIAGGLLLVLSTDYRIASARAVVGLAEVRVGIRFPLAGLAIVRQELAPGVCRRLLLAGNVVSAEAAGDMAIVDEVVDPETVMERALAVAEDRTSIPPKTFAAVKGQLRAETLAYIADVERRRADPLLRGWFNEETKSAAQVMLAARAK